MGSCLSSDGGLSSPAMPSSPAKKGWRGSRKRGPAAASRSNSRREEQLHRIPGRMFLNDSSAVASLFSQQGKKGINQDAMVVWENFGSRMDTVFCGVFDGHGPQGHMVARRVRDSLPLKLSAQFEVNTGIDVVRQKNAGSMSSDETGSLSLNEELGVAPGTGERYPDIFPALKESFLKAFKVMDKELKMNQNINCFCSGTTAVTLIKQGQDLVIGNVGDSRAILGTRDQNNHLVAIQLTVDLKPNLPHEAERIRRCKGRVFALQDEPQVARVWLPHNDSPGLAMARAFGDFCLKEFGLISVPEISYRRLTEKDEFLVLATDGVWDVLSNKEVVDIVSSAPGQSSAARSLVESAVKAWKRKYPTSRIDDCAAVCLFLNSDAPANCTALKNRELDGSLSSAETSNGNHSVTSKPFSDIDTDKGKEASEEQLPRLTLHGQPPDGNGDVREWSAALDGVSRVDTLLTLPRFATKARLQDGNT